MKMPRREFIKKTAGGMAVLSMPMLFNSCSNQNMKSENPELSEYFKLFSVDEVMLQKILSEALKKGGDYADLFFEFTTQNVISMEDKSVNKANSSMTLGMGVRVLNGDQTGYSFTEDLSMKNMISVAQTAAAIANTTSASKEVELKLSEHSNYYPIHTLWEDVSIKTRIEMLEYVNNIVFEEDSRITKANLYMSDVEKYMMVVDSRGRISVDYQPLTRMGVSCVAEMGTRKESNGHNYSLRESVDFYTKEKLVTLGKEAVKRTLNLFDAVDAPVGEFPVVLAAGSSGILLHEAIGHGMEADFNRKGISIFSDKIDKKVAEDFVTIVDSGLDMNLRGSINVDDEGNLSQETHLVQDGILRSYMHDIISAKHYNVDVTGSGRRESFKYAPLPRMRNTYMKNGPHTFNEIIESTKYGIYADQFTNGEVNIGAGDFTFYIKSGYLIENGKMTKPIKDVNIIGNGPDVLKKINMVADDFKFSEGGWTCGKSGQSIPVSLGLPTCKVSSITVGGKRS